MLRGWMLSCGQCLRSFVVCETCDRNRRKYCSNTCAAAALKEAKRRARYRHQRSEEGLADHRERNRDYRERLRVMDTCSENLAPPVKVVLAHQSEGAGTNGQQHEGNNHDHSSRDSCTGPRRRWRLHAGALTSLYLVYTSPSITDTAGVASAVVQPSGPCCALCGRVVRMAADMPQRYSRHRGWRAPLSNRGRPPPT